MVAGMTIVNQSIERPLDRFRIPIISVKTAPFLDTDDQKLTREGKA